jgi:hypothetical protein
VFPQFQHSGVQFKPAFYGSIQTSFLVFQFKKKFLTESQKASGSAVETKVIQYMEDKIQLIFLA